MSNITINKKLCVHCGACTAVCSVNALNIDPITAALSFTKEKCTKCSQCIDACPLRAIHIELITDTSTRTAISE
jgi:L-aspartate semialdehyde sulfurtransferase ferredoxin